MKRLCRKLTLSLLATLCVAGYCIAESGLMFRSYDVSPNQRTSLRLPSEPDGGVVFSRGCRLSFELRIDMSRERFGYVCRVIFDDTENLDILLSSPYGSIPYVSVVTSSGEFEPVEIGANPDLGDWRKIDIDIAAAEDSLRVSVNGKVMTLAGSQRKPHTLAVLFGANDYGRFATSDVAPMHLRNLTLKADGGKEFSWTLSSEEELTSYRRIRLSAANPLWMQDLNRRWHLVNSFRFPSKVFAVPDPKHSRLLLVTADRVVDYDPVTNRAKSTSFAQDIRTDLITNDFFVLPDGRLIYADLELETPFVSIFDFETGAWSNANPRTRKSRYLHHNVFFNNCDSSLVQLFGYGYHRYTNEVNVYNIDNGRFRRIFSSQTEPRYLSSVGMKDGDVYIYGGKGNDNGVQELGQQIYNDLYRLDPSDYSAHELWSLPSDASEVAAADLVISDDGESFMALTYSPNVYESKLVLKRISIADGSRTEIADAIPYYFLDVDSEARLIYSEEADAFFAVVSYKEESGSHLVNVWRINNPIFTGGGKQSTENKDYIVWCILGAVVLLAALFVAVMRRRSTPLADGGDESELTDDTESLSAELSRAPGVYLLGGFRVIDRNGTDISNSFTPLMKQLLSAVILHSDRPGGISNVVLKELFWYDKSNESYINNRGVNIKKIRNSLKGVGDVDIVTHRGNWYVSDENGLCDWLVCTKSLDEPVAANASDAEIEKMISLARRGTLLPGMRADWVDSFKAHYTDRIISRLQALRSAASDLSPEMQIRLADAVLLFDSLDEESIRAKCRALIRLKRLGSAQKVYANFIDEYERLMGEKYSSDFRDFVNEQGQ